jgi:hypothetical protein
MSRIFGEIRQNGYVVRDIETAMHHWIEVLGVGPWFYAEDASISDFLYRGEPSEIRVSIALANSGPLQIELIQQRNDAPSLFKDFLDAGNEGLQHVAYWTERFATDRARALEQGYRIGHEGNTGRYGPFCYFLTEGHPGTVVELSDIGGPKKQLFEAIAVASRDWDGADPVRSFADASA